MLGLSTRVHLPFFPLSCQQLLGLDIDTRHVQVEQACPSHPGSELKGLRNEASECQLSVQLSNRSHTELKKAC